MVTPNRREFIKTTAATAAALASGRLHPQPAAQTLTAPSADPLAIELANEALNAARSAGASYADVRIGRYRRQAITTRERQVTASATPSRTASASARWSTAAGASPPRAR